MISRLRKDNKFIYYNLWKNIPISDLHNGNILEYLEQDLIVNQLTTKDISKFAWIVDLQWEGHSPEDIEPFRQLLIKHGVKCFGAVFTSYVDVSQLPYPALCLVDRLIHNGQWYLNLIHQNIDWQNLPMTHNLVCLMRRPSVSRCMLANQLLNTFDSSNLVLTLGTGFVAFNEELKQLMFPRRMPLAIDGILVDDIMQHKINHTKFYEAPLQIIPESSSQTDKNVWHSQFITEKTYKALSWYQFPIWYAVPGLVERVREQGFDVFDDVINHSYDLEIDPWKRMSMVVSEARRLISLNAVQLRKDHWSRLESNADLINGIHNTAYSRHRIEITRLKNEIQQLW